MMIRLSLVRWCYKFDAWFTDNSNYIWEKMGTMSITSGYRDINLWAREDGIRIDKIYLTTGSTAPTGTGPAQSSRE